MSDLSRAAKIVVVALCTALLFTVDAWAFNVSTHLSIDARTQVPAGKSFRITGWLHSNKTQCRSHETVRLIKQGKGVVDTDQTTKKGKYFFSVSINKTRKFHTKYSGKVTGHYPNSNICRASHSDTVTVQAS